MSRIDCISAAEAVRAARTGRGASTAICWCADKNGISIRLAAATPFGGVVKDWSGKDSGFLDRLVAETITADSGDVYVAGPVPDAMDVAKDFAGSRPVVPSAMRAGERTATWWSRMPKGDVEFRIGDELGVTLSPTPGGHDVEYRDVAGRWAGLHARMSGEPTSAQRRIVADARAVVERIAFGMDFDRHGQEIVTQILMLRIPHDLANAFPGATLPRLREMELD